MQKLCSVMRRAYHSRPAQMGAAVAFSAVAAFAQSGDISSQTSELMTLGKGILALVLGLATLAAVGVIIWGAVTIGSNRPRGLAMVGGGIFGALILGLSFALVTGLTGQSVSPTSIGTLMLPFFLS